MKCQILFHFLFSSSLIATLIPSEHVFLVQAQKNNYRPYNPIQNIFDSIFRGPPGQGSPPPNNPTLRSRIPNPPSGPSSSPSPGILTPPSSIDFSLTAPGNRQANKQNNQKQNNNKQNQPQPRGNLHHGQTGPPRRPKVLPPRPPPLRQRPPPPHPHPRGPPVQQSPPRILLRPHAGPNKHHIHPSHIHTAHLKHPLLNPVQDFSSSQPSPVVVSPDESQEVTSVDPDLSSTAGEISFTSGGQSNRPPGGIYIRTVGDNTESTLSPILEDNAFLAPQLDFPEVFGNDVDAKSETQQQFKLKPRGHSGPVIISKIPVRTFQAAIEQSEEDSSSQLEETQVEEEQFFFPNDSVEQLPQPSPLSSKEARSLDPLLDLQDVSLNDDHHHHHNHNHLHEEHKITKRIDEVRELVDCGGRDLGFCDMSSKYPGHMMGNLMSDCQELVYTGFVPVPEDIEELGDSNPVAKYTNSSKSSVRAQQGSWSWKPYEYKKKQICDSELRFIRPGYARDSTGKWQVIVQTDKMPQRVAIDLCHAPEQPCFLMSDCGRKSRCVQRYTFQHLLAVDPDNLHQCPTIRAFKFPAACVCHVEFPDHGGF